MSVRLEVVFADAEFRKSCAMTIRGAQSARRVREECGGRKTESFRTLHYRDVPSFVKRLRAVQGTSARALEFGLLTAARIGEIRGPHWCEINFASETWTLPADRMKGRETPPCTFLIVRSKS